MLYRNENKSPTYMAVATFLAGIALSTGALGQEGAEHEAGSTQVVDVIIVTAQKREERLIDVPIAAKVTSGEALWQRQIDDVADLTMAVPSLTYTPGINDLITSLRVRGIGTILFNQGLESSVSYVLDGVPLARQAQAFQDLIDIERVEVLPGPQGMLFGKNATAGVINVVTQRPTDEISFVGDATVAELDEYRVRTSVAGPLADGVSGRLTGFYNDVGGQIRNVANGEDLNGGLSYGGRALLAFEPADIIDLLLIGDYRKAEQDCCQWQAVRADNPLYASLLSPVVASTDNRTANINADLFNDSERWGVSLQGDVATGLGGVTSITTYREWDLAANNDIDSIPTALPLFGLPVNFGAFDVNLSETTVKQFSQELRLTSDGNQAFNYVVGLYYLHLDVDRAFTRRIGLCFPPPRNPANGGLAPGEVCNAPTFLSRLGEGTTTNENYALFGQGDWNVIGDLKLIAGFRLQRDKISYAGSRPAAPAPAFPEDGVLGPTFIGGPAPSSGAGSTSNADFSGRLGVQYQFNPDAQTYFTFTQGYKGPGFDIEPTTNFADQTPVRPETVDAFELGFKGAFLDGALGINVAAFHQTYDDLQVQASTETGGLRAFFPTNAGNAESQGVEIELLARPAPAFLFTAGLTFLDAEVDVDGLNCIRGVPPTVFEAGASEPLNTCFRFADDARNANRQNIRDGDLPNAPRFRGVVSGRYDDVVDSLGLRVFAQVSAVFQSEVTFSLEQDPEMVQDGYPVVDASVGIGSRDRRYTLTLYARNLFDENYANVLLRSPTWPSTPIADNINGFFSKESNRYFGANFRMAF